MRLTVAEKDLGTDTRPASVESVRHAPMTQLRIRLKSQPQGPRPPSPSAPPARSHHFLANLNLSVTLAIASSALPPSASSSVTPHPTPPAATRSPLLSRLPFSRDSFFYFLLSSRLLPIDLHRLATRPYSRQSCARCLHFICL